MARTSAHGRVGRQLMLDGRAGRAVEALEHALSSAETENDRRDPSTRQVLAQAWLAAGDPARARAIAEEVLTCCLEIGCPSGRDRGGGDSVGGRSTRRNRLSGGPAHRRGAGDRGSPDRRDRRLQPDALCARRACLAGGAAGIARRARRASPSCPRSVHKDGSRWPSPRRLDRARSSHDDSVQRVIGSSSATADVGRVRSSASRLMVDEVNMVPKASSGRGTNCRLIGAGSGAG